MSHTTTVKATIKSKSAIERSIKQLATEINGIEILYDAKPRMYYSNQMGICDIVIKLPGAYDVGLKLNSNNEYDIVFDEYANHVSKYLGSRNKKIKNSSDHISKFLQEYSFQVASETAFNQGYLLVDRQYDTNGNIQGIWEVQETIATY